MGTAGILPFGGSSATTDRKYQLLSFKDLSDLFNQSSRFGVGAEKKGQGGVSDALDFFHNILTGNRSTIGETLAAPIDTIKNQDYERKVSDQQFGTRSGGTNSRALSLETNVSDSVDKLLAELFPDAAKAEGSLGVSETGLGLDSLHLAESSAADLAGAAGSSRKTSLGVQAGQANALLGGLTTLAGTPDVQAILKSLGLA